MELSLFLDKFLSISGASSVTELNDKLLNIVLNNDIKKYESYCELVNNDLSEDLLQKVYQYYQADRNGLKQDYTPKTLAKLVAKLSQNDEIIDMCCGSGALTIQKWNIEPDTKFTLYELDENVIPYLLFNLAVRNIKARVYRKDVLSQEIFDTYDVIPQERFSRVIKK